MTRSPDVLLRMARRAGGSGAAERIAQRKVHCRLDLGDAKSVARAFGIAGDYGPGYRVYFALRDGKFGRTLCGGDRNHKNEGIKTCKAIASEFGGFEMIKTEPYDAGAT